VDKQNLEFIRLLEKSGWTQAKAAEELGLTTGAISQFVSGIARPKTTVIRLFKMLVGDASGYSEVTQVSETERGLLPLDGSEVEFIREMRKMEPQARKKVVNSLKTLLSLLPPKK
jgi:transcriptional regulator with XRE-family HTH domain